MNEGVFDLSHYYHQQEVTRRWRAERENSSARLELSQIKERMLYLLCQHEPIHRMGLDREKVRILLDFLHHGDKERMNRNIEGGA